MPDVPPTEKQLREDHMYMKVSELGNPTSLALWRNSIANERLILGFYSFLPAAGIILRSSDGVRVGIEASEQARRTSQPERGEEAD